MPSVQSARLVRPAPTDHAVLVTSDSHVGPLVREQLRDYCPEKYLAAFDEFTAFMESVPNGLLGPDEDEVPHESHLRNALSTGGWDPHERLREMDRDGVAAEVVYHGLNAGPRQDLIPFAGVFGVPGIPGFDLEHVGVGRQIYNRWLVDFVSVEPERHAGLAHLPMWDPDAAVVELEWAAEHGLRGVNFPRPQPGVAPYNSPVWERFWSACEDLDMPLATHAQTAGPPEMVGNPGEFEVFMVEMMGDTGRRALYEMVFGGVFERHPSVKLLYTEILDTWWQDTMARMDDQAIYIREKESRLRPSQQIGGGLLTQFSLPRLPSEYCHENLFIGWTAIAPFEVRDAIEHRYDSQVLWGSDYPHPEGTWQYPRHEDEVPMTHLHLRDSFAGVPSDKTAMMLGGNAIRVFGLDTDALVAVSDRINSPTFEQLATPLEDEPEDFVTRGAKLAFRRSGPSN